jgi:hypothetical protein
MEVVRKEDSNCPPKLLIFLVSFGGSVVMYPQLYPLPLGRHVGARL